MEFVDGEDTGDLCQISIRSSCTDVSMWVRVSVDVHFPNPLSRCRGPRLEARFAGGLSPIV